MTKILTLLCVLLMAVPALADGAAPAERAFIPVPLVRQATGHTCGVAALQSVLYYYGIEYREDVLAEKLQAADYARAGHIVRVATGEGLSADTRAGMTLGELQACVDRGQPVMVCLQAWSDSAATAEEYRNAWEDGHWVVVNGYDSANIYVMDPSTLGNYAYVPVDDFLARWHDYEDDLTRPFLQYGIIFNGTPAYDPQARLRMR